MASPNLLDVIIRKSPPILKLFAGKDQALLVWGNALFLLYFLTRSVQSLLCSNASWRVKHTNLVLHIIDRVGGFDLKSDGLSREGFDEAILANLLSV
jgi:hypothetical protein